MSYASNYNLNSRLSYLESLANGGGFPTSSNLQDVLDNGSSANGDTITLTNGGFISNNANYASGMTTGTVNNYDFNTGDFSNLNTTALTINNPTTGASAEVDTTKLRVGLGTDVATVNPTQITITDGTTTNTINKTGYTTRNSVQNATHFLNFSDSSATGTGAIQKTAGLSCNPSTNTLTASNLSVGDVYGPLLNFRWDSGVGLATKASIRDAGLLIVSGSNIFLQAGTAIEMTGTTGGGAFGYINGVNGVPLRFNGAQKFTTTNTGVSITGTTDTTTINNASGVAIQNNGTTQISTTASGVVVPPNVALYQQLNNSSMCYFSPFNATNPFSYYNFDLMMATANVAPGAGKLCFTAIALPAGFTLNNIFWTAGGVAGTVQVGLYNGAGTLLASSASATQTASSVNRRGMTTPYTIPAGLGGIYYIAYNNDTAGNVLTGLGISQNNINYPNGTGFAPTGTLTGFRVSYSTGATTYSSLPATLAGITTNIGIASIFWVAVN